MEGVQLKSSQMSVCMKVSGHFPADGSYDRNKFTLLWHKLLMLWKLYKNLYKKMFIVFFKKKKVVERGTTKLKTEESLTG